MNIHSMILYVTIEACMLLYVTFVIKYNYVNIEITTKYVIHNGNFRQIIIADNINRVDSVLHSER